MLGDAEAHDESDGEAVALTLRRGDDEADGVREALRDAAADALGQPLALAHGEMLEEPVGERVAAGERDGSADRVTVARGGADALPHDTAVRVVVAESGALRLTDAEPVSRDERDAQPEATPDALALKLACDAVAENDGERDSAAEALGLRLTLAHADALGDDDNERLAAGERDPEADLVAVARAAAVTLPHAVAVRLLVAESDAPPLADAEPVSRDDADAVRVATLADARVDADALRVACALAVPDTLPEADFDALDDAVGVALTLAVRDAAAERLDRALSLGDEDARALALALGDARELRDALDD